MKILNLYACLGGNRYKWNEVKSDIEVTAVELDPELAKLYQERFPNDKVIVADAHQYLLDHYEEFDFIWSSPPCPSHSRIRKVTHHQNKPIFPNMKLYEEILFLKGYFKGKWVVENVVSWYDPLIKPFIYKEHYYWSNFVISGTPHTNRHHTSTIKDLEKFKKFNLDKYQGIDKNKILRNCVEPEAGLFVFQSAFKDQQRTL